jgi:uncharacterized protein YkwD
LRKVAAAALALPVLALLYLATLAHRSATVALTRKRAFAGAVAVVALGTLAFYAQSRPAPTTAQPPTTIEPLAAAAFSSTIEAGTSPSQRVTITFAAPMDPASVRFAMRVEPFEQVVATWDDAGTILTVRPVGAWKTSSFHTITIPAGTLQASGQPIPSAVRASFLTRDATVAKLSLTEGSAAAARISTGIRIAFDHPVEANDVELAITPAVEGTFEPEPGSPAESPAYVFAPGAPLAPGTTYTVALGSGVRDADGVAVSAIPLTFATTKAPAVVRFRPGDGAKNVVRTQKMSVRFSQPMDRASTQAAWRATAAGTAIAGSFAWFENDTVLQFTPKAALGYGQKIAMSVGPTAMSKAEIPLSAAADATFTTVPKPVVRKTTTTGTTTKSIGGSTWAAVEAYYLKLMNCTRTGGWVTSTGACSSPGGRSVAPLWQDSGITAKVSRPYAKKLAVAGVCSHYYNSTPSSRLKAAGYSSYIWAENLGCRSGDPYAAVLGSHLFFQSEKSYNGGHYVNLMNAKYDRCGIGVWVYGGRVRLVVDFYHPL